MIEPTKDMPEWERQLRACVADIPAYADGREIAAALAEIDRLRAENIDLERRVTELTAQAAELARLNCQITDGDMNLQRLAAVTAERDSWQKCHDEMSDSYARGVLERERLAAEREQARAEAAAVRTATWPVKDAGPTTDDVENVTADVDLDPLLELRRATWNELVSRVEGLERTLTCSPDSICDRLDNLEAAFKNTGGRP